VDCAENGIKEMKQGDISAECCGC